MNPKYKNLITYSGGYTCGQPLATGQIEFDDEPDLQTLLRELTERVEKLEAALAGDPAKPAPKEKHGVNSLSVRRAPKAISPRTPRLIPAGVVNGQQVSVRTAPN